MKQNTHNAAPLLLEVRSAAAMPPAIQVVASHAAAANGPSLESVLAQLSTREIEVRSAAYASAGAADAVTEKAAVWSWIQQQREGQPGAPVIVLFHSTTSQRSLGSGNKSGSSRQTAAGTPPTMDEIAQYQIVLWTIVGLLAIIGSAVVALGGMHVQPDSILYAKFISGRTKTD